MLPQFFSFVLSFLVIGSFWNSHHTKFRFIRRYNRTLITLNLLLLMAVAFIPFPTCRAGRIGQRDRHHSLCRARSSLASLLSALEWWYAVRRELVMASTSQHDRRYQTLRPLLTALVFGLSIPIALYNANLAKYFWAVLIPITIFVR